MADQSPRVSPRIGPSEGTRFRRRLAMRLVDPVAHGLLDSPLTTRLPPWPRRLRASINPPSVRWAPADRETPPELRTVPGIKRLPEAEEEAFRKEPLRDWVQANPVAVRWMIRRWSWNLLPVLPPFLQAERRTHRTASTAPAVAPDPELGPEQLTALVRAEAARLGLSAVGFAPYDPKYTFAEYRGQHETGSVIVCVLDQNYDAHNSAPSVRADRSGFVTFVDLMHRAAGLAEMLHERGYRAHAHSVDGETVHIHYGVEAGLGQLGVNGQLLTPQAGSRAKLTIITTNAVLVHDGPVDYGIEAICDACQVCVRRCPVGAIPTARREYRGIVKSKLNMKRCAPVVAQADGCAVCVKTCPIQRYGLDAVKRNYLATGTILGKGTADLETYRWPLDGRRYGPGQKPRVDVSLISPPGWKLGNDGEGAQQTGATARKGRQPLESSGMAPL
jgi:epoxyqueuosine reductase